MRPRNLGFLLAAGLLLGPAPAAHAATLPFTASLSITIGALPGATFSASGTAVSNGAGMLFTLPSNVFSGMAVFTYNLFTGVPQISGVRVTVTGNAPGSFAPGFAPPNFHPTVARCIGPDMAGACTGPSTPGVLLAGGGVGGAMQVQGVAGVNILLLFSLSIPLSKVGSGTTTTVQSGMLIVQPVATQFTTGMGYVLGITADVHLPTSTTQMDVTGLTSTITGSDARTPGGVGVVTLVSPVKVITSVAGNVPVVVTLRVNFVPEPGTVLLLGGGIVALAIAGRRRSISRGG